VQDLVSVAERLRVLNQPIAAERIGRTAIASYPENISLNLALAYALLDQNKINEAKIIVATIEKPKSAPLQLAKASIAEAVGNFDNALDYIEIAASLDPSLKLTKRWSKNLLLGLESSSAESLSARITAWQTQHKMALNDAFNLANSLRTAGFGAQATQLTISVLLPIPLQ
jgi:tetratricopeptide (TPR) repeat protein